MLRITVQEDRQSSKLVLEGRLAVPWIAEVDKAWSAVVRRRDGRRVVVDLSGVTSIEESAKALLRRMYEQGGELRSADLLTRAIVDEVQAPAPASDSSSPRRRGGPRA
jgi:hypothetical protein